MLRCSETPPCDAARFGAVFLTYAIYIMCLSGLSPMLTLVEHGNAVGIVWAVFGGLGIAGLVSGIGSALTHDDPFRPDSFIWSCGVLLLGSYALLHGWVLTDNAFDYQLTRALWLGWMAGNLVGLVLNLRSFVLRRRPAAVAVPRRLVRASVPVRELRGPLLSRYVRVIETLEEFGADSIEDLHILAAGKSAADVPPRVSPELTQMDCQLYIQHGQTLIPLRPTGDDADRVPVHRPQRDV